MEGSEMRNVNPGFWNNKKVFLTGNTGFKGTWASIWLEKLGAVVKGYSLKPSFSPNFHDVAGVDKLTDNTYDDIRNFKELAKNLSDFEPEIVIHMAAQPLVRQSYKEPLDTFSVNIMGTANLLEACRVIPSVKVILNVTTDKCYKNNEWLWGYREYEPLGGFDPYSSSKACSELITSSYRDAFYSKNAIAVSTARAGNVIGGGDWSPDRLIPDILRSYHSGTTFKLRNPQAIRPWQHVLEPLLGYFLLIEEMYTNRENYSQAWNFGPRAESEKTVEWITEKIGEKLSGGLKWRKFADNHLHEANFLKLDSAKANTLLNWKPRWNLDTTLEKIVQWYGAQNQGEDMLSYSMQQIDDFQNHTLAR